MSEERATSEILVEDGQKVSAMVHGKGWMEVVKPALLNRELSLMGEFSNATTYEEFVRIQQAVSAIRNLLAFIEVTLAQGKSALEDLKKNP